jgi:hypothetical protein
MPGTPSDVHAGVTGHNLTKGANGSVGIYGVGGQYAGRFDGTLAVPISAVRRSSESPPDIAGVKISESRFASSLVTCPMGAILLPSAGSTGMLHIRNQQSTQNHRTFSSSRLFEPPFIALRSAKRRRNQLTCQCGCSTCPRK